jgi:importin-7
MWGSQYVSAFLVNLVRYRTKDFLINLMDYIVNQIMQESANFAPGQQRPADVLSRKFGALEIFASLGRTIKKSKAMKPHLEQILANHVLPELRSDCLFLRAKACQVFSVYYNLPFQNPQLFVSGVELVLANVTSQDECVRGLATISLHLLIQSDLSRDVIHHVLPNVIDVVFDLVDSLDNQDIVKTLESLIATFPEDIAPRAVDAVKRLSEHWFRLVQASRNDPNDDISTVTALHIGGAIATLCDACSKTPQIYPALEPYVIPICQLVLKEEMTEYLDEVLKILVFLSLHETPVSDNVWSCFQGICNMLTTWAADYVAESLAFFDNLISRSTDKFLTSGALDLAMGIYTEYVTNPKRSEYASGNASQIMEVILVYCRGRVDAVVPHAIRTALQRYSIAKTETLRILCLEVVANAIIYNPQLALGFLESQGFTNDFFTHWLNAIMPPPKKQKKKKGSRMRRRVEEAPEPSPFSRLHDKQVCIMALSSIFHIPIGTLPASIQQFLPGTSLLLYSRASGLPADVRFCRRSCLHLEASG